MLLTEQMKSLMKRNASLGGMLIPAESKFALKVCIFCCSTKFSHVRKKNFKFMKKLSCSGPGEVCGGKHQRYGICGEGLMCSNCNRCQGCSMKTFECFDDRQCIWSVP